MAIERPGIFHPGDRFELHIDRLSVGDRGVGRKDGIVVFVDLVAPAEDVEVEVTSVKKNLIEAELLRVVEPSQHRIEPPCVHFRDGCGGCSWQHVSYAEQLRTKRELVAEALRRFSGFQDFQVETTVASPLAFRYRNRIQVHIDRAKGRDRVGFHARGTHRIVDIKDCLIAEVPLLEKLEELRWGKIAGERIQIYRNQENEIGVGEASEQSSLAFSQVNSSQNAQLIQAVLDEAKKSSLAEGPLETVLDLYSGSGNFTFPLAREFPTAEILGVELNPAAVRAGNENAKNSGRRIRFQHAKAEEFLKRWKPPRGQYLILVDPPRTGCDPAVLKILKDLKPIRLIYVSCHPVTLARDLKSFSDAGWSLEFVQPFDMFPQTDHVETLVVLEPKVMGSESSARVAHSGT